MIKNKSTRPAILIIIDDFGIGGAEILLAGILPALNARFSVVLVTLTEKCHFRNEEIVCDQKYSLGFTNKLSLLRCIMRLKRIIKSHQPVFIHAHLFYSSLIARLACPSSIPLFYSLHNEMSKSIFNNSKIFTFIERKTVRKNHSVIAVSKSVLTDYENTIKKIPSSFVLRNYISDDYFAEHRRSFNISKKLRIVAVGNIKDQKNYGYLIKAFKQMAACNISLDVYGNGHSEDIKKLNDEILQDNLPISFKGGVKHPCQVLPDYDLFVSCSTHEGFGIAPIEAMATGLPLLLSDLPVYHEVTFNNAIFFNIQNPLSFVEVIEAVREGKYDLANLSEKGKLIAQKYTKDIYLNNLFGIYDQIM